MKTLSGILRSSTCWTRPLQLVYVKNPVRGRISDVTFENCGIGYLRNVRHNSPSITEQQIEEIEGEQPEYVTRHVEEQYLAGALKGYYRIGTLVNYRAKENDTAGRLGDVQESRQHEIFRSRTGYLNNALVDGVFFENVSMVDVEKHIVFETVVNDYCSCTSQGVFKSDRANKIRDAEDDSKKKPGAFITYHLPSLKIAITEYLQRNPKLRHLKVIGRKVSYGEKDVTWEVEEDFSHKFEADALAIWLGISFIKSPTFSHEEEFRLLLVDPKNPGSLDYEANTIIIEADEAIAAACVASGVF